MLNQDFKQDPPCGQTAKEPSRWKLTHPPYPTLRLRIESARVKNTQLLTAAIVFSILGYLRGQHGIGYSYLTMLNSADFVTLEITNDSSSQLISDLKHENKTFFFSSQHPSALSTTPTQISPNNIQSRKIATRLILHIGPPKTASTTLQQSLGALSPYLFQDGYIYLGKRRSRSMSRWSLQEKILNGRCHAKMESFRVDQSTNQTDILNYTKVACWQEINNEFQDIRRAFPEHNIILSEEAFSQDYMLRTYENQNAFKEAFLKLIEGEGMKLQVVASYRHLEEQVLSAYKMKCSSPSSMATADCQPPTIETLNRWITHSDTMYLTRPLDRALAPWLTSIPGSSIQILDLENRDEHPTVQFVCSLLGMGNNSHKITHTCIKTRQSSSDIARQRSIPTVGFQIETLVYAIFDDVIVSNNASEINHRDVRRFLKELYHDNIKQNCTIFDLPWSCPSHEQLSALLEKSLQLEQQYRFPIYWKRNSSYENMQKAHNISFWTAAKNKQYCDLDRNKLFHKFPRLKDEDKGYVLWRKLEERLLGFC